MFQASRAHVRHISYSYDSWTEAVSKKEINYRALYDPEHQTDASEFDLDLEIQNNKSLNQISKVRLRR